MVTKDMGILVPPEDADAMARAALSISDIDRHGFSAMAIWRAVNLFSVPVMLSKTMAVYDDLINLK